MKRTTLGIALSTLIVAGGCGSDGSDILSEQGIQSIVFLQRAPRLGGLGDIFQYQSYQPGGRLMKLTPPTADGELEVLCCDEQGMEDMDIGWYDIHPDATRIVFSGKLSGDQRWGLFVLTLEDGKVEQIASNPNFDYVYAVFTPGEQIFFMTNNVVEEGAPQHRDEYERGTTTQVGTVNIDGSNHQLHARNLSHRVFPTLMSDGRVMYTQWDHLGDMNAGHLVFSNPDGSVVREGIGKEGSGVSNSYLKSVEVSPGRVIAIATSRNGTIQSGALVDFRLGESYPCSQDERWGDKWGSDAVCADRNMSEANATNRILTPLVPRDMGPSSPTIGRYYDAFPITAREQPHLLVSWADGPVDDMTLGEAGLSPDFGIYLFDAARGTRKPIFNTADHWEVFAKPLKARAYVPQIPPSATRHNGDGVLIGSMNVYESSIADVEPGSIYGVRILEGFSTEEGIPDDFGLTEHEGSALVGVAPVELDGSWAAIIPANVPVHLQTIDVFGMSIVTEPVWISGNNGESRLCGGCHEDRAAVTTVPPGVPDAIAAGAINMNSTRDQRFSLDYSRANIVGVPWGSDSPDDPSGTGAVQAIFNAKCVSCHNGVPGPANPSYTIMDTETGEMQTITFDLRGVEAAYGVGDSMMSGYSASHLSLLGPDMMDLEEENPNIMIVGEPKIYVEPNDARGSELIQRINPPQLYPTYDASVRAFGDAPIHPVDVGGEELTEDEYHVLILMVDSGGQYYSRENSPGLTNY